MMSGEAGLVVEKLGGGMEHLPQSSMQNHHQRDVLQVGEKKTVNVRTDWAAKYLK